MWEWVADYSSMYPSEPQTNPTGPETGERKVARGGSFHSSAEMLHATYRHSSALTCCNPDLGFRCAAGGSTRLTSR